MKLEKDDGVYFEIFYFIEFIEKTFGHELYGYADAKVENKELNSIVFLEHNHVLILRLLMTIRLILRNL